MNTNNCVKWRRLIVPKQVEQINDYSFIDTSQKNKIYQKSQRDYIRYNYHIMLLLVTAR